MIKTLKKIFVLISLCCLSLVPLASVHAVDEGTIQQIEKQIDDVVQILNTNRSAMVENHEQITQLEKNIKDITEELHHLNLVIDGRLKQAKARMVDLQTNNEELSLMGVLLGSSSIFEFFEKLFIVLRLQELANEQVVLAKQSKDRLDELQVEQVNKLSDLKVRSEQLVQQTAVVEQKRQELEVILRENQEAVAEIIKRREEELANQKVDEAPTQQTVAQTTASSTTQTNSLTSTVDLTTTQTVTQVSQQSTTIQTSSQTSNNDQVETPMVYTLAEFRVRGVIYHNGLKFTYYSELVLPGRGLRIPGRHVNANGYVVDENGYIVLANDAPIGTIIDTPFGAKGKVYDRGTFGNQFDVYIR